MAHPTHHARPAPPYLDLSDEALRTWVVEERADWQGAYDLLFHQRHGGVIKKAVGWVQQRYGKALTWEVVIERLFHNMRGRTGAWNGLRSWKPEKGAFPPWLWVIATNTCRRLLREPKALQQTVPLEATEGTAVRQLPDPAPHPDLTVTVMQLLDDVGGDCAHLLRLKYYYGLTDSDVARQQGVRRETINRHRRRCEQALADLLHREGLQPADFGY